MIATGPLGGVLKTRAALNKQPDGTVTVSNLDGTVVSIQPDGREESRTAGTNGPFERATPQGAMLVYFAGTTFGATQAYCHALVEHLPND